MGTRTQNTARFLLASGVSLTVSVLAILVAWHNVSRVAPVHAPQWITQQLLSDIDGAIAAYLEKTGSLPRSLDQVTRFSDSDLLIDTGGVVLDPWGHPLHYSVNGSSYTVVSYGRDGEPGGVWLDCDLSNFAPHSKQALPTLSQFLFEMETGRVVAVCLLCGIVAFFVCLRTIKPTDLAGWELIAVFSKIAVTIVAAIVAAVIMSLLHMPSGH